MDSLQKHYSLENTANSDAIYFKLEDDKHDLKNSLVHLPQITQTKVKKQQQSVHV